MCFLAVLYQVVPDYPVVLAANRDEFLDRPGLPPRELAPGVWGGRDGRAGGTWLGVNARGLVSAVANILDGSPLDESARSRGLLCLDALGLPSAGEFPQFLGRQLRAGVINPFNLVVADGACGWLASYAGGNLEIAPLGAGLHVIGNSPPDAKDDPKVAAGRRLISPSGDLPAVLASLQAACRFHGERGDRADAICVHGPSAGTLSSSLLAIGRDFPRGGRYLYADGPPCQTPYEDVTPLPWREGPG